MKILAIEKDVENVTGDMFKPFLKDEAKKVWEFMQAGIIREIYFTKENNCAVLILECSNEVEADSILKSLPLVKEKLISFDVKTLIPYSGFERLFN